MPLFNALRLCHCFSPDIVREKYDLDLSFCHTFSAETISSKREWIQGQTRPTFLFTNCDDLGRGTAYDVMLGRETDVPGVVLLLSGFPCQSKTRLNPNRSKMKDCIKKGEEKTGVGFQASRVSYAVTLNLIVVAVIAYFLSIHYPVPELVV